MPMDDPNEFFALPVEGHIYRLKLLKRQMYGRASFVAPTYRA